jgi:hypothetical protein
MRRPRSRWRETACGVPTARWSQRSPTERCRGRRPGSRRTGSPRARVTSPCTSSPATGSWPVGDHRCSVDWRRGAVAIPSSRCTSASGRSHSWRTVGRAVSRRGTRREMTTSCSSERSDELATGGCARCPRTLRPWSGACSALPPAGPRIATAGSNPTSDDVARRLAEVHQANVHFVAPFTSADEPTPTTLEVAIRKTCHGGGPPLGAVNGAVNASSATSAGQPCAR